MAYESYAESDVLHPSLHIGDGTGGGGGGGGGGPGGGDRGARGTMAPPPPFKADTLFALYCAKQTTMNLSILPVCNSLLSVLSRGR